ncbi:hypothetical protein MPER_05360 [Moniliophthora perniciosa FA553]|nr:hypothetical protein MPER_05360 [Moniliophthora perniciosa FA553]
MMSTRVMGMGSSSRQADDSRRTCGISKGVQLISGLAARSHVARNVIRSTFGKHAVQTQSLKPEATTENLNKQRLNQPSGPHFTIYQPQLTWLWSIANCVTGAALSALLYGFSLAYPVVPDTFSSASVVEFVSGLPEGVKYAGKAILAAPFSFHAFNGLSHLTWDSGKFLTVKGAYYTGYTVLGASAISTIYLTLQQFSSNVKNLKQSTRM